MPFVKTDNANIYYIEQGSGDPVMLIHGNWSTSSWWEPVLARLPDNLRGIAYDVRGRGQTTISAGDYSIQTLASDLRDFADALKLDHFHLVGHSLGSAIAMQFALDHPGYVRSLTALSPSWVDGMPADYNMPDGHRAFKADRELLGQALKAVAPSVPDDAFWQRLVTEGFEQDMDATIETLNTLQDWQPGDQVREIAVPKLVVGGEQDLLTGGAVAVRAAEALGARHVVLPDIGHSPNIEAPDVFVQLLIEHFATTKTN